MTMTDSELEAIKACCDAATPGPWEVRQSSICHPWTIGPVGRYAVGECFDQKGADGKPRYDAEANAALMAHAREDIPALLAEIERLKLGPRPVPYGRPWLTLQGEIDDGAGG